MARANEVIDHYLNGPGSYFNSGTRKPLAGDLGPNTIGDLSTFRDRVIASKQFADDPNSILDSVVDLVDRTIKNVKDVVENNQIKDENIQRFPQEDTFDSIQTPKSPLDIQKDSTKSAFPISRPEAPPLQSGLTPQTGDERFLARLTYDPSRDHHSIRSQGLRPPRPPDRSPSTMPISNI